MRIQPEILRFPQNDNIGNSAVYRFFHSARFASISMLMATVWLIPETDSIAGANIKLKSRRVIGSVVTAQRVRVVSLSGVSSFT